MKRQFILLIAGGILLLPGARLAAAAVKAPPEAAAVKAPPKAAAKAVVVGGEDAEYGMVERAGVVAWPDEFKMDAKVLREKDGQALFGTDHVFFAAAEEGREVKAGDIYAIFRAKGHVRGGEDRHDLGVLFQGVGEALILYADSQTILARVQKQYDGVRAGDGLRLQEPDRNAYEASKIRKVEADAAKSAPLQGSIARIANAHQVAATGEIVYLDLGWQSGLVPGEHFQVSRPVPVSTDRPGAAGELGEVEVISVQKETAAALVVGAQNGLSVGDEIQAAE